MDKNSSSHLANKSSHRAPNSQDPLLFASCRSGTPMAIKVKNKYQMLFAEAHQPAAIDLLKDVDFDFSDGETCVRLEKDVNSRDVFLFQALQDPTSTRNVNENYLAFMQALRTFYEWGAKRVTGVLPYLAYTRQDKYTPGTREPISVALMADLSIEAGLDRLVVWAPHDNRVHGYYGRTTVNMLQGITLFKNYYKEKRGQSNLIGVAPDAGAAEFMIPFCRDMNLNTAVTAKYRPEPEKAAITDIMGDFEGMQEAIVLDDMINTGGTVEAVVKKLYKDYGIEKIWLGVSHFLGSSQAQERILELHESYGLEELIITDSVPATQEFLDLNFVTTHSLAEPFAQAIYCIHHDLSLTNTINGPND